MSRPFSVVAVLLTVAAVALSTRSQTFTYATIDGRVMRLLVRGSGPPTVVFESGLGPPLEVWGKIQPEVSRFARTVSYDRAGVGLSAEGPLPRDGRRIAYELREALRAAGLPPPYILVGASLGGLYVRVFAGIYPDDVSGMVLVDPTHDPSVFAPSALPEVNALRATAEQARSSHIPAGIPLVLIDAIGSREVPFATTAIRHRRAGLRPEIEAESHAYKRWLESIPGARLVTTDRSGHNVPIEQPQLVIDTIRDVVQAVSDRQRSPVR